MLSGVKERLARLCARRPFVDHLVRWWSTTVTVNGNGLAAAVTYFAFLSFFPILALAFAIFGQVAKVYDNAEDTLVDAANSSCPASSAGRAASLETLQERRPGSSASASC